MIEVHIKRSEPKDQEWHWWEVYGAAGFLAEGATRRRGASVP
jgi:hypothetical protein